MLTKNEMDTLIITIQDVYYQYFDVGYKPAIGKLNAAKRELNTAQKDLKYAKEKMMSMAKFLDQHVEDKEYEKVLLAKFAEYEGE